MEDELAQELEKAEKKRKKESRIRKLKKKNRTKAIFIAVLAVILAALAILCVIKYREYTDRITVLENRIGSLETQVGDYESKTVALGAENSQLKALLADCETEITGLNDELGKVNSELAGLRESHTSLQADYDELKVQYEAALSSKSGKSSGSSSQSNSSSSSEKVDYTGKKVYLTFDDGPSKNTTAILEVLAKYNIKGTFFVIGDGTSKELMKKIVDEGHSIGIHTYDHDYNATYKNLDAFKENITKCREKILDATGVETTLFRFPGGANNTVSMYKNADKGINRNCKVSEAIEWIHSEGLEFYDWDIDSGDTEATKVAASTIKNNTISRVKTYCKKNDNCIVLMHDAGAKTTTPEALPEIIETLLELGFKFEALSPTSYNHQFKPAY